MVPRYIIGIALCLCSLSLFSQEYIFLSPDKVPDCSILKKGGTFKSQELSTDDYTMVVSGDVITEYVQHKKYYLKSRIEFISPCTYTSRVIEVTIPAYSVKPGAVVETEILQTQGNAIRLKTRLGDKSVIAVLEKIK